MNLVYGNNDRWLIWNSTDLALAGLLRSLQNLTNFRERVYRLHKDRAHFNHFTALQGLGYQNLLNKDYKLCFKLNPKLFLDV